MTATAAEPLADALTAQHRWDTLHHLARLEAAERLTDIERVLLLACLSPLPTDRALELFACAAALADGYDDHTEEQLHATLWVLVSGQLASCTACRTMGLTGVELRPVREAGATLCEYHYSQQSWVTDPRRAGLVGR